MQKPAKGAVPPLAAVPAAVSTADLRTHCTNCNVRGLCLPVGVDPEGIREIDALVTERVHLRRGELVYRAGDPFGALYAIHVGSCKTTVLGEKGYEQVAGYHMMGDIVGLDGIAAGRHGGEATALEDTEVCVLPFHRIEELAKRVTPLLRNIHRMLSREIGRDENVMLLLGSMRAEERLAVFLLSLASRYRERGYSGTEFVLRLTRADIGSYLGLKLETVSRLLSRFQASGMLQVQGRVVKLLDVAALRALAGQRS